ncbi:MAG: relaxase/mobilization nuclease domain-containing protein [Prevotella sp.]|jgi:hypothetical protein|nr:relaxase/mobilization nuclease domain-containing protein [Prevotella sp.]
MVAKISHGASLYGAVCYNRQKVSEGTARVISGNRMITDTTGNPHSAMRQVLLAFEPYLAANMRTEKPVLHISLNPALDDRLSDGQFASLAKDYMERMNYGGQPYIVYMHEDTGRRHIHIVSVCVDETGRKIDDSYERRRSMSACRELEVKYGLRNITDDRKECDRIFLKKVEYGKGDIKRQISNVLKNASEYKFRTFGEYSALLSCFNIEAKTVKGEGINGKPFNGIVYSVTDDTGKTVSNPFKSSLFGKPSGYEGLNKRMARNEKGLKDGKYAPMIRGAVAAAMKATHDKEKFVSLLQGSGIDAVFRINDAGRLYGATFIDHSRKEVYNGSVLGREFSANVFHRLFNEAPGEIQPKAHPAGETRQDLQGWEFSPLQPDSRETALEQAFGIFDFPSIAGNSTDYEEEAFRKQMKRKRKKKQQRKL